jgi:hypothetical protein
MTDEQMRDLVKECGLDWQRGYMPLFDGDPTNRYAVLIESVEAAERERCAKICESEPERQRADGVWACDQQACAEAIRRA